MSIISIKCSNKKELTTSKPLLNVLHQIKSGLYQEEVIQFRQYHQIQMENPEESQDEAIPLFSIAGHFKQRNNHFVLISYSEYLLFEIPYLTEEDMELVRKDLMESSFVFAVYQNTIGTGLNFIVRIANPFTEHKKAFRKWRSHFHSYLKLNQISTKGESIDHFSRFSWDPHLYLNLDTEILK